jgi:PAS domain S-box-containing protein
MLALSRVLPSTGDDLPQPWAAALVTAVAYAGVGWVALMLAGPPGYASPLYPSAGIALAAVLTWGWSAVPGVWLGSLAVNVGLGTLRGQEGLATFALPAVIGAGAALQATVGAALTHARIQGPIVLNSPRDIAAAGLLGAIVACTVSPSVATKALLVAGSLNAESWLSNWVTWWLGDTLGTLIAAPLVLTLIGRPRADWAPRRLTLGLPLLAAIGLLAAALAELNRIDQQRVAMAFEREADQAASRVQARLKLPLYAVQATYGAALSSPREAIAGSVREAATWWLAQEMPLQSIAYFVRVPVAGVDAFEAQARREGLPGYRVFDREGTPRARDGEVLALRVIEPMADNERALGVNVWSVPAARAAVMRALQGGSASASAGFKLAQWQHDETGLGIYQPLYEGQPSNEAERREALRGAVSVTFRAEALLQAGVGNTAPLVPPHVVACLVDPDPSVERRLLAGPPSCAEQTLTKTAGAARGPALMRTTRQVRLADRMLELRFVAAEAGPPSRPRESSLMALTGLSAAAMLGALLLTVTGHSRRTEVEVADGTASLRREMAERSQAEEALRDSEERLRTILDHVPLGVVFLDPDGRLIDANPPLARMIGKPLSEMRGQRLDDVVVPGDQAAMREALDELVATMRTADHGGSVRRTLHFTGDPGRPTSVRVYAVPLLDPQRRLRRIVAVVEDITEHLRLEASEQARQRAEASDRAKSEFVSRMSHELRTPLNAMIGFAQLLGLDREPALVAHQRDWAQQIQRAGWHLLEMINETLDLARIESGAVRLALQPVALAPLIAAAKEMVSASAAERQVELSPVRAEPPDLPAAVQADPTRLRQIMTNLLSNGVKYNRPGGRVGVTVRPAGTDHLDVVVSDTGLGMTESQLKLLFQPYNRLGREASSIEGTGIGLVISRRLAELMGGQLTARSAAGVGSEFTLRLPLARGEVPPPAESVTTGPAPYRQRTVHYIEDNETNVEVMRGVLLQRPQIELSVSTSGLDGVQDVRRLKPDLVLLDMGLPDISGLELLRHLKQDDDVAGIPVIVVSADATPSRVQDALTLGALHYVTKPLDVAKFLGVIDDALEGLESRWGM